MELYLWYFWYSCQDKFVYRSILLEIYRVSKSPYLPVEPSGIRKKKSEKFFAVHRCLFKNEAITCLNWSWNCLWCKIRYLHKLCRKGLRVTTFKGSGCKGEYYWSLSHRNNKFFRWNWSLYKFITNFFVGFSLLHLRLLHTLQQQGFPKGKHFCWPVQKCL